jgi:alpha-ketoglutarate-dependent taurine dioxygenase
MAEVRSKVWEPIKDEVGARILLSRDELLSGGYAEEILALVNRRSVLVFPELNFSDEDQVAFARQFGELESEVIGGPEVHRLTFDPTQNHVAGYIRGSWFWHFDGFMNESLQGATLLSCRNPGTSGGDTEFANTAAAYRALPEERKQQIETLYGVHTLVGSQLCFDPEPSYEKFLEWRAVGRRDRPLVMRHDDGSESLAIGNSAMGIVGMDVLEAKDILVFLLAWSTQDRFSYRHKWTAGDMLMWENRRTLHRANPYPEEGGRMMHRTKLAT